MKELVEHLTRPATTTAVTIRRDGAGRDRESFLVNAWENLRHKKRQQVGGVAALRVVVEQNGLDGRVGGLDQRGHLSGVRRVDAGVRAALHATLMDSTLALALCDACQLK